MTSRTHDLAAFTALGLVVLSMPLQKMTLGTGLFAIAANLIGGIAPDIDQPTAPFWRNLPIGGIFGKVFDKVLLGGHRFISHSIAGMVLFGIGWYYLLQFLKPSIPKINTDIVWWAFIIGYLSHLIMDTITREGVPWLLPIPIKIGIPPIKELRIQTGGLIENFIVFPLLLLFNGYLYYTQYSKVLELLRNHLK